MQIVVQIAYSHTINEESLVHLQSNVELRLKSIQEYFGVELIPKHHNLLHLATLIRRMGLVLFLYMMRKESKHKVLKSCNFRNINKTIAIMHQQTISTNRHTYKDNVKHGTLFSLSEQIRNIEDFDSQSLETKWLKLNGWVYRKGLFIFKERIICKIEHILFDRIEYSFVVSIFRIVNFDPFLNGTEIEEILHKKYEILG